MVNFSFDEDQKIPTQYQAYMRKRARYMHNKHGQQESRVMRAISGDISNEDAGATMGENLFKELRAAAKYGNTGKTFCCIDCGNPVRQHAAKLQQRPWFAQIQLVSITAVIVSATIEASDGATHTRLTLTPRPRNWPGTLTLN